MVEILSPQFLYRNCYEQFLDLTHPELLNRFYGEIVPGMDRRRRNRGGKRLGQNETMVRMWSTPGGKPGETRELTEVLRATGLKPTPQLYGEIADMVYRTASPYCPDYFRYSLYWLMPRSSGFNVHEGLRVCDAKYLGRIRHGDEPGIKEIEFSALQLLIDGMDERGYQLFSGGKTEEIDLYRLWLGRQPHARVKLMLDRLKIYWPFWPL